MRHLTRRLALVWLAGAALFSKVGTASAGPQAETTPATQRYICTYNECDPYVYDPVLGDADNIEGEGPIPPGTPFSALPKDWLCPVCGAPKEYFERTEERWTP